MARATFNDIKDELARVASNSGMTASDPKLKARVHSIQTRLGYKGNWRGINDMLKFWVYDRVLTLPMQYEAAVRFAVDEQPMPVMPGWYEFLEYGPGPQDDYGWVDLAVRRGQSPLVRQSTDLARKLRVYSYADERTNGVPNTVTVLGYDENDNWVRSQNGSGVWQDGITLDLNGHDVTNWAATSITLKRVTRILKTVTVGRVEFYWVDDDDTTLYFAGKVDHYETNPMYERFVVPSLGIETNTHTVKCVARRRIQKIITGDEELLFDNIEAYRLGLIGMAREESDKPQSAQYYWYEAKQCLLDEFISINGDSVSDPKVNVVGEQGSIGGTTPEIM